MPDTSKLDRTPSTHWPAPQLTFTPDATDGPVMVTVTYQVAEDKWSRFTDAMHDVGRSRRRTGALRWELFRDGGEPTRFVESYLIGTWEEHVRRRENRLTGADRRFEEQARGYAVGDPQVAHLFPPPAKERARSGNTGQHLNIACNRCGPRLSISLRHNADRARGDDRWPLGRPRQMPARVPFSRK